MKNVTLKIQRTVERRNMKEVKRKKKRVTKMAKEAKK